MSRPSVFNAGRPFESKVGSDKPPGPDALAERVGDELHQLARPTRLIPRARQRDSAVMTSASRGPNTKLTPADEAAFISAVGRLGVTDPRSVAEGLALLHVRELRRGEYLLRAGELAVYAGVLVTGLLREHFVTSRGVDRTKGFVTELQFTGSLADLLRGEPARASIVADAPARLVVLVYAQLRALQAKSSAWATAGQHSAEQLVRYKAEREYEFLCLTAEERYAAFSARHPHLEARVSGLHIASFLGITPVHLSRLRARRARARRASA